MALDPLFRSVKRKPVNGDDSALLLNGGEAVRDRIIIAAIMSLSWVAFAGGARAAAADGDHRSIVDLAVTDALPTEQVTALRGLLESQLPAHGLSLRMEPGVTDVRRWLSRESSDALLRVALDASADRGWRLLLVDAPRGRAVARTLTGGVKRDRAAVEAVCDIVVSAALALREGLEVASQTVAEALTDAAPSGAPSATPTREGPPALSQSGASPGRSSALRAEAGVGPAVATFARAAPASWGAAVAISVWRDRAGLEVTAARYLSQTVAATAGSFDIDRTQVGISADAAASWRRARLSGGLGLLFEILQRGDAAPAAGSIAPTPPDALTRLGPQATATLGLLVSRRVTVTWAVGLAYFPRRVTYSSTAGADAPLAEPWPLTGVTTLRINVAVP
jgi:hypothetical protein